MVYREIPLLLHSQSLLKHGFFHPAWAFTLLWLQLDTTVWVPTHNYVLTVAVLIGLILWGVHILSVYIWQSKENSMFYCPGVYTVLVIYCMSDSIQYMKQCCAWVGVRKPKVLGYVLVWLIYSFIIMSGMMYIINKY